MRRALLLFVVLALAGCGAGEPTLPVDEGLKALRSGNYDEAIANCGEAIRLEPEDSQAYLYRGRAYHFRNQPGDLERAISDFTAAIRLNPKNAEAYYSRALAYADLGEVEYFAADEKSARELDDRVKAIYAKLPDTFQKPEVKLAPPPEATAKPAETTTATRPAATAPTDDLESYRQGIRKRLEASRPRSMLTDTTDSVADDSDEREPGPFGRRPGYRVPSLTGEPVADTAAQPSTAAQPVPAERGEPQTGEAAAPVQPARPFQRGPQASPFAQTPAGQGAAEVPLGPTRPLQSPFQPPSGSTYRTPFQSPFPQQGPRPTGYVEPANPFSQQQPQQPRQFFPGR